MKRCHRIGRVRAFFLACVGGVRAFRAIHANLKQLVVRSGDKVTINYEVEIE